MGRGGRNSEVLQSPSAEAKCFAFRRAPSLERWQTNTLAVWPSLFAVSLGLMAVIPFLAPYLEERFGIHDPVELRRWTAVVFGAGPLAAALVGPFWGALGDRVGRRPMAIRSVLAIAVVMALLPLSPSPMAMVALRLLQGAFAGYVAPAIALVSADAPPERQGRTIAGLQVALAGGQLFGPFAGAEIAGLLGRAQVFYVTSGMCLLAVVPLLFAREDRGRLPPPAARMLQAMAADLRSVVRQRAFVLMLALVVVLRLGLHMVEPFVERWVRELGPLPWVAARSAGHEHAVLRTAALMYAVLAVSQFVATPIWGRLADRIGPVLCLSIVALGLAAVFALTGTFVSIEEYLGLRVAASLFMAGGMTLAYAAASRRVDPRHKSLSFALVQSCIQLGISLGPIGGSWVVATASLRAAWWMAAALVGAAGIGMVVLRFATERPRRPAENVVLDEKT
jgi:DHA1 family multidrug resistance protein-like MFS transporter